MWKKELPNSTGDWLFLTMWDCGCCVFKSGIIYISETNTSHTDSEHMSILGNGFTLHWEGQRPDKFNVSYIEYWMKIQLP